VARFLAPGCDSYVPRGWLAASRAEGHLFPNNIRSRSRRCGPDCARHSLRSSVNAETGSLVFTVQCRSC